MMNKFMKNAQKGADVILGKIGYCLCPYKGMGKMCPWRARLIHNSVLLWACKKKDRTLICPGEWM